MIDCLDAILTKAGAARRWRRMACDMPTNDAARRKRAFAHRTVPALLNIGATA